MTQKIFLVLLVGAVSLVWAGETVGTVVTPGRILINDLAIRGNASLNEGAVVRTSADAARIELAGGGAMALDAGSEAVIRRGGLNLRHGKALLLSGHPSLEALGLKVEGAGAASRLLVAVSSGKVEVAALEGSAQVRNRQGLMLAMVRKETPLRFEPGSAGTQSTVTGILRREGERFSLKDELTGIDVELKGSGLPGHSGGRIQATGEAQIIADSDKHVILVSKLNRLPMAPESSPSGNSSSASTKASTTAAKAGMSVGTKISVAALAFGGMAAAIAVPMAMSN